MAKAPNRNHRLICPVNAGQNCLMPSGHTVALDEDGISDPVTRKDAEEMETVQGWGIFERPELQDDEEEEEEIEVPDTVPGAEYIKATERIRELEHAYDGKQKEFEKAVEAQNKAVTELDGINHSLEQHKLAVARFEELIGMARNFATKIREMVKAPVPDDDEGLFTELAYHYPGTQDVINGIEHEGEAAGTETKPVEMVLDASGNAVGKLQQSVINNDPLADDDEAGVYEEPDKPHGAKSGTHRHKSG